MLPRMKMRDQPPNVGVCEKRFDDVREILENNIYRKKKCFERLELRRYSLNITVLLIILCHIYVPFLAVPLPPINLKASDCKDWTAKLSWVADPSNNASITHYLIEQESSQNPVIFISLLTVTNPDTTSVFLKLSKESVPRFRVKAVNNIGASRPSLTVETSCKSNKAKVGTYMYFTKIPWKLKTAFCSMLR